MFITQVMTLCEVKNSIHFNQDTETDVKEIKYAVGNLLKEFKSLKATVHEIKEHVSYSQPSDSQPCLSLSATECLPKL